MCVQHDFHYEYTECDSDGGRWRVSVPKPKTCLGGAPNPPVRGKGCGECASKLTLCPPPPTDLTLRAVSQNIPYSPQIPPADCFDWGKVLCSMVYFCGNAFLDWHGWPGMIFFVTCLYLRVIRLLLHDQCAAFLLLCMTCYGLTFWSMGMGQSEHEILNILNNSFKHE